MGATMTNMLFRRTAPDAGDAPVISPSDPGTLPTEPAAARRERRRLPRVRLGAGCLVSRLRTRLAPYTVAYLLVLLATTLVLRHVSEPVANRLLQASSTDVAHLAHDPLRVLVASALWLPGRTWLPYAVVLLLVLAPLERRVGPLRTAAIFLSGHVLATLLTELPIAAAIALHWLPPAAAHRLDVGASYGMYAAVGAYVGILRRPRRELVLAAALVTAAIPLLVNPGMTPVGHLLSLGIGVCWWGMLRSAGEPVVSGVPGRARVGGRRDPS